MATARDEAGLESVDQGGRNWTRGPTIDLGEIDYVCGLCDVILDLQGCRLFQIRVMPFGIKNETVRLIAKLPGVRITRCKDCGLNNCF
jgi:hypothetical protein